MKRTLQFAALGSCTLIVACAPIDSVKPFDQQQAATLVKQWYVKKPAQQRVSLALSQAHKWKKIDLSLDKQGTPVMLIPLDQTQSDWHESISSDIRPYKSNPDMTAERFVQTQFAFAQHNCKHADTRILAQTMQHVTYRINSTGCHEIQDSTQIGKAFNGQDAVYVVYYTALSNKVAAVNVQQQAHTIETAQLVKDPRAG